MLYFGTKLSDNISIREPEGYLYCLNVPVARTGMQEYLPEELGLRSDGHMVEVFRPEEEVFSPACIASFEGMPITNDHPEDGVTIENIKRLGMGHVQNVRQGTEDQSDLLIADLVIQDKKLIDLIMNQGKREISCGYTYLLEESDGKYFQTQIRGNHVAVVDAGRAGHRVCIKDHKPIERRKKPMKKSLYKKLAKMARDGDPEAIEAVAEIAEELIEAGEEPEVAVVVEPEAPAAEVVVEPEAPAAAPEAEVVVGDEDGLGAVIERLDRIIELLTPAAAPAVDEDPVEEIAAAVEEAVEAVATGEETPAEAEGEAVSEIAEVVEEVVENVNPEGLDPAEDECNNTDCNSAVIGDALRTALAAIRPALSKMTPKQRKRTSDAIAARIKKMQGARNVSSYAAIAAANDRAAKTAPADLGKRIMEKRNAHYVK